MGGPTGHSPLGASGAYRWLPAPWGGGCYASAALAQGVSEDEEDDTFSKPGTAAHALGEQCLASKADAYLHIGKEVKEVLVDKEMADAVQVYLNTVRLHEDRHQGNSWVERSFHCPSIHELFYGTADFVFWDEAKRTLHVYDYKHGAGIVVEAERNPQCMYYACGVLEDLDLWDKVDKVIVTIVQPRGFHWDGPVRSWEIATPDLEDWLEDVLIPAMDRALVSRETRSGEHCRFCPARLRDCPQLREDKKELWSVLESWGVDTSKPVTEMVKQMKNIFAEKGADKIPLKDLARALDLLDLTPILKKAYEQTAFNRMTQAGAEIPGRKLVHKRMNRDWKPDADKAAKKLFGKRALTTPEFKSPAQIDEMPKGKTFTAEWAFKPEGGLTIAAASDSRRAVEGTDVSKMFKPVKEKANG